MGLELQWALIFKYMQLKKRREKELVKRPMESEFESWAGYRCANHLEGGPCFFTWFPYGMYNPTL